MSTRSFIARRTNNSFEGAYCHWDGYPEHNGLLLFQHYRDPAKVRKLLSHGDMSVLRESVGKQHAFDERTPTCTTYYGRDRGETGPHTKPRRRRSLKRLMRIAESCGCEYFYLLDEDGWKYAARGSQFFGCSDGTRFSPFKPLTAASVRSTR